MDYVHRNDVKMCILKGSLVAQSGRDLDNE